MRDDFNAMGFLKLQGYFQPISHWGFNPKRTTKEAADALSETSGTAWKSSDVDALLKTNGVIVI
jgi:hypothetical protein